MADLLLHSLREFDEIIFGVLSRRRPRSVLEIGSETGRFSTQLMNWCMGNAAELFTIEPKPMQSVVDLAAASEKFHLVIGRSVDYLSAHGCPSDFILIDGDHNYFTVHRELSLIDASWKERGEREGIVLLHDVGFPCGRRDAYYEPAAIPPESLHPHSYELGITLDRASLIPGGFRGEGSFAWAQKEGGPKNGVLTAVEDFLREHPEYTYRSVDAVFGLGAITRRGSAADEIVAAEFAPYDNALLRRLERNRLELYLRVIALQDAMRAQEDREQNEQAAAAE